MISEAPASGFVKQQNAKINLKVALKLPWVCILFDGFTNKKNTKWFILEKQISMVF